MKIRPFFIVVPRVKSNFVTLSIINQIAAVKETFSLKL